jgi:hypothetical protein
MAVLRVQFLVENHDIQYFRGSLQSQAARNL